MRSHGRERRPRGGYPHRSRSREVQRLSPNRGSPLSQMRSGGGAYLSPRRESGYLPPYRESGDFPTPRASEERGPAYSQPIRDNGRREQSVGALIKRGSDYSPSFNRRHQEYPLSHRDSRRREHLDFQSRREIREIERDYRPARRTVQEGKNPFSMEFEPTAAHGAVWEEQSGYEIKYYRDTNMVMGGYLSPQPHFDDRLPQQKSSYARLLPGNHLQEPPRSDMEDKSSRGYAVASSERDNVKHNYEQCFSNIDQHDMLGRKIPLESCGTREFPAYCSAIDRRDILDQKIPLEIHGTREPFTYFSDIDRHDALDRRTPLESCGMRESSAYYPDRTLPRTPSRVVGKFSSELESNMTPHRLHQETKNIYFEGHRIQPDGLPREGYMVEENPHSYAKGGPGFEFKSFEAKSSEIGSSYDAYKSFSTPTKYGSDGMLPRYDGCHGEIYEHPANANLKSEHQSDVQHMELTRTHEKVRDYVSPQEYRGHLSARHGYDGGRLIRLGADDSIPNRMGEEDATTFQMRMGSHKARGQNSPELYFNYDYIGESSNTRRRDVETPGSGSRHLEYGTDPYKVHDVSNPAASWSYEREPKKSRVMEFSKDEPDPDWRRSAGDVNMYRQSKGSFRRVEQSNKMSRKHKHGNFDISTHNADSLFLSKRAKLGLLRPKKVRKSGVILRLNVGMSRKFSKRTPTLQRGSSNVHSSYLSTKKRKHQFMNSAVEESHEDDYSPPKPDLSLSIVEPAEGTKCFQDKVFNIFLKFVKKLNEDPDQRRKYIEQGRAGSLRCIVCGSDSEEFTDTEGLVAHAFVTTTTGLRAQHLGLHRALCLLMGWNSDVAPNSNWACEELSDTESSAIREDLIIWPPVVILHNVSVQDDCTPRNVTLAPDMLKTYLEDIGFGKALVKVGSGKPPDQNVMVAAFRGTLSGLEETERLHGFFNEKRQGRGDLLRDNECGIEGAEAVRGIGSVVCGYLGLAGDFDKVEEKMSKRRVVRSRKDIRAIADANVKSV